MTITRPEPERRMSHTEAVALCRYAKAACPQQAFDEYTPDAWADLLADLRYEDCHIAVRNVVKRQPFIAPAEIRDEVRRIRNHRIKEFGPLPSPESGLSDEEYDRWFSSLHRSIADGDLTRDQVTPELPAGSPRDVKALLERIPVRKP